MNFTKQNLAFGIAIFAAGLIAPSVLYAGEPSCAVTPFSQTITAGETANFSVSATSSSAGAPFDLTVGNPPLNAEFGFGAIASDIKAIPLTIRTSRSAQTGSLSLVVIYREAEGLSAVCQLNLIVREPPQTSQTESPAAAPSSNQPLFGAVRTASAGGAQAIASTKISAKPLSVPSKTIQEISTPTAPSAAVPAKAAESGNVPVRNSVSSRFNTDLAFGSRGEDVLRLQKILAQDPTIYPEGLITGFYGAFTKQALRRFQQKSGIPATGVFDSVTRAKFEEMFKDKVVEPTFTKNLRRGYSGEIIKTLQEILKRLSFFPNEVELTANFGPITEAAVRKFQESRGFEPVGIVGPKTRVVLNDEIRRE